MKTRSLLLSILLFFLSVLYGLITRSRIKLYDMKILKSKSLKNPVISIGNLTVGGTGKTPMVELTARLLKSGGETVSILSHGYRARDSSKSILVSDGTTLLTDWEEAGDEPFLLARNLPGVCVLIGKDRYLSAKTVEEQVGECVFILDDGYQHLKLARNLNILLIDATDPFGNKRLLPLGSLREPLKEIRRADLIVITRSDHPFDEKYIATEIRKYNKSIHMLFAYHDAVGLLPVKSTQSYAHTRPVDSAELNFIPVQDFSYKRVVAVAGIGRPEIFFKDLTHFQIELAGKFVFPDHHAYAQAEVDAILEEAKRLSADGIITTEKDAVKIARLSIEGIPFYYLKIQARIEDEGRYKFYLENALGRFGV